MCIKVVQDALDEEIMLSRNTNMNDNSTKDIFNTIDNDNGNDQELTTTNRCTAAPIDVAFDMGWQKRAGGRVYDSLSGHGFLIGQKTGKVISFGVLKNTANAKSQTEQKNKVFLTVAA